DRVLLPDARDALHERQEVALLRAQLPAQPGNLVVLAVGVVVAALGVPDLVAAPQHRNALREQERRDEVPLLLRAQGADARVVGGSLDAAVPAQVVVLAVAVSFAVRFVVLVVVADEILERKAVVAR